MMDSSVTSALQILYFRLGSMERSINSLKQARYDKLKFETMKYVSGLNEYFQPVDKASILFRVYHFSLLIEKSQFSEQIERTFYASLIKLYAALESYLPYDDGNLTQTLRGICKFEVLFKKKITEQFDDFESHYVSCYRCLIIPKKSPGENYKTPPMLKAHRSRCDFTDGSTINGVTSIVSEYERAWNSVIRWVPGAEKHKDQNSLKQITMRYLLRLNILKANTLCSVVTAHCRWDQMSNSEMISAVHSIFGSPDFKSVYLQKDTFKELASEFEEECMIEEKVVLGYLLT